MPAIVNQRAGQENALQDPDIHYKKSNKYFSNIVDVYCQELYILMVSLLSDNGVTPLVIPSISWFLVWRRRLGTPSAFFFCPVQNHALSFADRLSIAVKIFLKGAVRINADVIRLLRAQPGEPGSDLVQMQAGDFLVQLLG
jgi:hypothetical protein